MKRSVSPPAPERVALLGLAIALAGTACAPDQSVQPGAPQLIAFGIVQAGPFATNLRPGMPDCPASPGGMTCNADTDSMCRDVAAGNWCSCVSDGADPPVVTWSCTPFGPVLGITAVFDRLLGTATLDPAGQSDVATVVTAANGPVSTITDYAPNGTPTALIQVFFNYRGEGPSLFTAPEAHAFASATTYTLTLDGDLVTAKDGTPFSAVGALQDGVFTFTTAPFSGSVAVPDPDNTGDPTTFNVFFTNVVDGAAVTPHVSATVNGVAAEIVVSQVNEGMLAVTPVSEEWPAGSTVVVSIDGAIVDILDEPIAAAAASDPYTPPATP